MYCTDSESISHLATRFRTNWLQIWASNDPEWAKTEEVCARENCGAEMQRSDAIAELLCETDVDAPRGQAQAGTSQVKLWTNTDSPHQVETGTLVRLGPTYVTRDEHSFAELAQRFNTNEWALVEMNPDLSALAADNARIPAGQEICVLPGICTAAAGAELDRGGDV